MRSDLKVKIDFKYRKIALNLLFFFLINLLFFCVIETILRSTHLFGARLSWSEPDSILGYKFTPNMKYWYD